MCKVLVSNISPACKFLPQILQITATRTRRTLTQQQDQTPIHPTIRGGSSSCSWYPPQSGAVGTSESSGGTPTAGRSPAPITRICLFYHHHCLPVRRTHWTSCSCRRSRRWSECGWVRCKIVCTLDCCPVGESTQPFARQRQLWMALDHFSVYIPTPRLYSYRARYPHNI